MGPYRLKQFVGAVPGMPQSRQQLSLHSECTFFVHRGIVSALTGLLHSRGKEVYNEQKLIGRVQAAVLESVQLIRTTPRILEFLF